MITSQAPPPTQLRSGAGEGLAALESYLSWEDVPLFARNREAAVKLTRYPSIDE